jgi:hypothetical protein
MKPFLPIAALATLVLAVPAASQVDVNRHVYTFVENRLDVVVLAEAPGVLQVVRGELGRIEVAARSRDGLAGSGLGGTLTRQLRLLGAGTSGVEYLVVVPEHVSLRVHLPQGGSADLSPSAAAATYRWGPPAAAPGPGAAGQTVAGGAGQPATGAPFQTAAASEPATGGLFITHVSSWAPGVVDIPDLAAVRSLSVRFQGAEFRIAASRPLQVRPGSAARMEVRATGDPLDLVLYVPREGPAFSIQSGSLRLLESHAGQPQALCGNVVVQRPSEQQIWLTFHPRAGQLDCR